MKRGRPATGRTPISGYRLKELTLEEIREVCEEKDWTATQVVVKAIHFYWRSIVGRKRNDKLPIRLRPERERLAKPTRPESAT